MISLTQLLIDNVDYTDYAVWTLQGQNTLDESLDLNYIELKGTNVRNPFKSFLDVEITVKDASGLHNISRLVESDTVTEVISNKTYNHNLLFIEETKWLERLFVEKTIRQPLIHDYTDLNTGMFVTATRSYDVGGVTRTDSYNDTVNLFNSVMAVDSTYTIYNPAYLMNQLEDSFGQTFGMDYLNTSTQATLNIYDSSHQLVYTLTSQRYIEQGGVWVQNTSTFNFTPTDEGSYEFVITAHGRGLVLGEQRSIDSTANFDISAILQVSPKPDYTIRDTVNQLFQTCITLRESETPIFSIAEPNEYDRSSKYQARIQEILDAKSPEFTFSKMTLFEALQTIGNYAHFIPRLKQRKLYFDLLGWSEYSDVESLGEYLSNTSSLASNDFCNALDSQVNNITNIDDEGQGSVSTPNSYDFRTLRAEIGEVQITDDQNIIIIPTEDNIEKIIKLEIGYLSDGSYVGDITAFVYEEDEYKTLSSYSNTYPTSKMYALKFKKGSPNITGLTFKRDNAVSGAFENIAIKNIIYKKLNKPTSWWTNFWDSEDVFKLQYKLTYIPSTNTRVTQYKNNVEDISEKPLYIAYNQSASKISSNAYGENLKGTIAKMGNIVETKMYLLPTFDLIPECGTLFNKDYYISVVKYEVYPNFIKCELGLSKNFNNKSAYVEINSQLEFFEYDRSVTIDRYVVYEEFCEISDVADGLEDNTDSLITATGLSNFMTWGNDLPVDSVIAQGYTSRGELTEVTLPVISLGVGNSLLFTFHYEDTISAGVRAYDSGNTRYQNFVKYTDIYGEVDTLKLKFGTFFRGKPDNYNIAVARGDVLPLVPTAGNNNMSVRFETGDNKIVLKKGVGEAIHFTYQIHFVAKDPDYIIGSAITTKSRFTYRGDNVYKVYALPDEINKFESKIDLTNAVEIGTLNIMGYSYTEKFVKYEDLTAPTGNFKSWALVQIYDNQNDFVLGKNIEFSTGDTVVMPAFTFKRRVK